MIAHPHLDGYVSEERSKFLRPRLIYVVVLDFTHFVLIYTLVLCFYTLHGGVMNSSVSLAELLVVILCCVHGRAADKHRWKCVKKEVPEPREIFETKSRTIFIADSKMCSKGRRKVLSFAFITETKPPH